jgi:hypothetical protein
MIILLHGGLFYFYLMLSRESFDIYSELLITLLILKYSRYEAKMAILHGPFQA